MMFERRALRAGSRAAGWLVAVAQPLLAGVAADARGWQPILELAQVVWNGVVRLQPKSMIAAELRRVFGPISDPRAIVDLIAARKCELCPDERFVIADVVARDAPRRVVVGVAVIAEPRTALRTAV
jgi:hypothetical protein